MQSDASEPSRMVSLSPPETLPSAPRTSNALTHRAPLTTVLPQVSHGHLLAFLLSTTWLLQVCHRFRLSGDED